MAGAVLPHPPCGAGTAHSTDLAAGGALDRPTRRLPGTEGRRRAGRDGVVERLSAFGRYHSNVSDYAPAAPIPRSALPEQRFWVMICPPGERGAEKVVLGRQKSGLAPD